MVCDGDWIITETPGRCDVLSLIFPLISWRSKSVRPQEGHDTYSYIEFHDKNNDFTRIFSEKYTEKTKISC